MIQFFLDYITVTLNYTPVKFAYGLMLAFAAFLLAYKLFIGGANYD